MLQAGPAHSSSITVPLPSSVSPSGNNTQYQGLCTTPFKWKSQRAQDDVPALVASYSSWLPQNFQLPSSPGYGLAGQCRTGGVAQDRWDLIVSMSAWCLPTTFVHSTSVGAGYCACFYEDQGQIITSKYASWEQQAMNAYNRESWTAWERRKWGKAS